MTGKMKGWGIVREYVMVKIAKRKINKLIHAKDVENI